MSELKTKNIEHPKCQTDKSVPFDAFVGLPPIKYNEIYLGDSFELCERVPAKTVDLILEDMPYNTTACEWDVKIDLELYWKTRLRILKPTGVVVLTASQPFTTILASSNLTMLKYEWIWDKSIPSNFVLAKKQPMKIHENILVFYEKFGIYNPIMTYDTLGNFGKKSDPSTEIFGGKLGIERETGLGYPKSIQDFRRPNNLDKDSGLHPTQKPVGLFEYLIRTYTNEGDLVFDGFGGSGTTAIAAYKAKRNFIVIEKEQKYFELAKRRLDNERAQCRLF